MSYAVVGTPSTLPLISLSGIRKRYGGSEQGSAAPPVEVLRGVSLDIHAGEFVAIVGASGSGKSTLMNILGCLDKPSSGSYRFAGMAVEEMDADALAWLRREAFGFVFQSYHLIPTESALENVEVPAIYAGLPEAERRRRATDLLQRLGLGERLDNRPSQLSGGQQQRVSIARALVNGGRIILADEPTGALDSNSGKEVMALFDELAAAGHTVILITHDRDVAARAQRVIEIRDGEIVCDSQAEPTGVGGDAAEIARQMQADRGRVASLGADLQEAARAAWRVMWVNRFPYSADAAGHHHWRGFRDRHAGHRRRRAVPHHGADVAVRCQHHVCGGDSGQRAGARRAHDPGRCRCHAQDSQREPGRPLSRRQCGRAARQCRSSFRGRRHHAGFPAGA